MIPALMSSGKVNINPITSEGYNSNGDKHKERDTWYSKSLGI